MENDADWFEAQKTLLEEAYLAGDNPRKQSGFSRGEADWEQFRRPIVTPVHKDGTFLDIGCASGHLMECLVDWAAQSGRKLEVYGLDISEKLAHLARSRLPQGQDRIFTGNALHWKPPFRFDFVRTELVYVPEHRRREYVQHLLDHVVAPDGRLILCGYGSSRPEGIRADRFLDDLMSWDLAPDGIEDVVSPEHGFVITRVAWLDNRNLGEPHQEQEPAAAS